MTQTRPAAARIDWDNLPDRAEMGRMRLLAAGRQHILRHGMRHLTVEGISAEAGLAKPSFYSYFRSRDEFLDTLRVAISADVAAVMQEAATGPWEGVFGRMVRAVAGWLVEHRGIAPLFGREWMADPSRPTRPPLVAVVADALDQGERAGVLRLLTPSGVSSREGALQATADVVFEALSGATTLAAAAYPDETPVLTAQAFVEAALSFDVAAARHARYTPGTV